MYISILLSCGSTIICFSFYVDRQEEFFEDLQHQHYNFNTDCTIFPDMSKA